MTRASGDLRATKRHILPSTLVSRDRPFRAAKVSSMRRESGTSSAGPIKDCGERVDNFADEARLEKLIISGNLLPRKPTT